ncbi:AAA family ATPase [Rhodococcus hoagii]|nr:AAA family ATPase [Prescottella equi]
MAEVTRLSGRDRDRRVGAIPGTAGLPTPPRAARAADAAATRGGCRDTRSLDARHDVTLVEGAGGLLVRLGADGFTVRDVAAELGAPVVVVAAAGLGTLNHCALTAEALAAAGVKCSGFVVGSWPRRPDLAARCNLHDLPAVTGPRWSGACPRASRARTPPDSPRPRPRGSSPTGSTRC